MEKYQIYVGRKRENNALLGFLEKGRTDILKGEPKPAAIRVGTYGIPNYTQAWGARLSRGKDTIPETQLNVDSPDYNGDVKFLKWGDKRGTMIECRWVRGYSTIDQSYQDLRLKVKIKEDDVNNAIITLNHGFNEFDEQKEIALVTMLKVHGVNDSSISKHPQYEGSMFKELDQEIVEKKDTKIIDDKFTCLSIVNQASSNNESVKALYHIVNGVELVDVNKDDVNELFPALKLFADSAPDVFAKRINDYKINVSAAFEKAKAYSLFDLTKDGTVAIKEKNGKQHIFPNMEGKGDKMLDYMFADYLKKDVFSAVETIKAITDKIK